MGFSILHKDTTAFRWGILGARRRNIFIQFYLNQAICLDDNLISREITGYFAYFPSSFYTFSTLVENFKVGWCRSLICNSRAGPPKIHEVSEERKKGQKVWMSVLGGLWPEFARVCSSHMSSNAKLSCADRLTPSFTHQFKVISQIDG